MFRGNSKTNSVCEMNWIGRNKLLYTVDKLSVTFYVDGDNNSFDVYVDCSDIIANNKKAKKYFQVNRSIIMQDVFNWIAQQGYKPKFVDESFSVPKGKTITGNLLFVGTKNYLLNKYKSILERQRGRN